MSLARLAIIACTLLGLSHLHQGVSAQGKPNAQNHHCKLPDGSVDMNKTHKQCTAAKGQWAKDAASADKTGSSGSTPPSAAPSK